MKHKIIASLVLFALAALALQFFLEYHSTTRRNAHYRSPPVTPLSTDMTSADHAPMIQSASSLMQKHFHVGEDVVPVVPAWIVQVANLSTQTAAKALLARLQTLGLDAFILPVEEKPGQINYRVNAGPFTQESNAMAAIKVIQKDLKMISILKQYTIGNVEKL